MTAPRIMVVEDEGPLCALLQHSLEAEGYQVEIINRGDDAEVRLRESVPDLLMLDWMLPAISGTELCRRLRMRPETKRLPIIILTARSDEDDTLLGFELGADDYVTKPYSPPILLARAKRLLESRPIHEQESDTLSSRGISIHFPSRTVSIDGKSSGLTHTEFEILAYLLKNKGIIISREQLVLKIWGYDFMGDDRTVNSHIRNLRCKLGEHAKHIVTVVRSGYKFEEEP